MFDRKTNAVEKTLVANVRTDYVRTAALSADGKRLFVPTQTPPRRVVRNGQVLMTVTPILQCWDTETWELDWTRESAADGLTTAVAGAPNGKQVAVSDSSGVSLLDATTGDPKGGLVRVKGR